MRVHAFLQLLGLTVPAYGLVQWLHHIFTPLALVVILFLGPLVMMLIDSELPFQSRFYWRNQLQNLCEWIGIRNYIVVWDTAINAYLRWLTCSSLTFNQKNGVAK